VVRRRGVALRTATRQPVARRLRPSRDAVIVGAALPGGYSRMMPAPMAVLVAAASAVPGAVSVVFLGLIGYF
jgi:hypothetical protein